MLSDRVSIMHKGKMLVCDTPKTLKDSIPGGDIVEIQLEKEVNKKILQDLNSFQEVVDLAVLKPNNLKVYLNKVEEIVPQIMELLVKKGVPVRSIHMSEPSLDDVFVHYTGLTIEEAEKKIPSR